MKILGLHSTGIDVSNWPIPITQVNNRKEAKSTFFFSEAEDMVPGFEKNSDLQNKIRQYSLNGLIIPS